MRNYWYSASWRWSYVLTPTTVLMVWISFWGFHRRQGCFQLASKDHELAPDSSYVRSSHSLQAQTTILSVSVIHHSHFQMCKAGFLLMHEISLHIEVENCHFCLLYCDCTPIAEDWIGLSSVLRPRQHSTGYMGDCFYRSKDPTNSIKVLKRNSQQHQRNLYIDEKYIYMATIPLLTIQSSFIHLAIVASQFCKITRNSEIILIRT